MDSKQHFFKRFIAFHFLVPFDFNVQVLKCEVFNGSLFYYVRWSDYFRDVAFLTKEYITIIIDCIVYFYGKTSHSYLSWKSVLKELRDETNNFSSKQVE